MADEQVFSIKQGDLGPPLKGQLVNLADDGAIEGPREMSGSETIVFNMRNKATGELKIDRGTQVTLLDVELATLQYEWQDGDTDTAGTFLGEFEVMDNAKPESFPNYKIGFTIKITEEIG